MDWDILLKIILIDLVMSGDNAVIIALAAKNVPKEKQKLAILLGTVGAIALRLGLAFIVVWLLKIPFLQAFGGVLLIWISVKLLVQQEGHDNIQSGTTLWSAIKVIIIADFVMSLDNVLAIAGAAHGHFGMILLGIAISIPIIVWGSNLIIKAMDKFPFIIYIGAGILTWTAGEMILGDKKIEYLLEQAHLHSPYLHYGFPAVLTIIILIVGYISKQKNKK